MHHLILLPALLTGCLSPAVGLSPFPRGRLAPPVIDKPAVKPPFSEAAQDQGFQNLLPLVPWTHERWDPGWLPQSCINEAAYTGFDAAVFEAVEVWYEDFAASWTVCRHERADESWFYILDSPSAFGSTFRPSSSSRVPFNYSSRKPPKELPFAYARPRTGVLTFMPSRLKLGVLFHETGHIPDNLCPTLQRLAAPNSTTPTTTDATISNTTTPANPNNNNTTTPLPIPKSTPFSSSPLWLTTLHTSPSLPTTYAHTSLAESFADALRWGMSHMTMASRGGLAVYSAGWEACRGQMEVVEGLLRGLVWPPGGECVGRVRGMGAEGVRVEGMGEDDASGEGGGRRGPGALGGLEVFGGEVKAGEVGIVV
ncbi:hypothetical protein C8A05DRAFT_36654 [Staphylotrichum tortipilum]|uniref:Uncharacterized protein n=1 Tax=Staphylotrichum tortipilum TaxID=2831512 RepID=A0AAN6RQH6_9PEZI|nr:hypothetical protein C8A05DRAFT_36654 [Staphylotrichum longicolle]